MADEPVLRDHAGVDTATRTATRSDDQRRPGSHRRRRTPHPAHPFWLEVSVLAAIALVIAVVVHTFFFQAFYIPSGSMENTLHVGDRVLVNRLSYQVGRVQRGQVVVFNGVDSWTPEAAISPPSNVAVRLARDVGSFLGFAPAGEKDFIKRVIGVPGDHVVCCNAQGQLLINGRPLSENYLYPGSDNADQPFDITVPAGRLWVEGDHRDDSADSRAHLGDPGGGTIPENKVVGRAFVIVWPFSHARALGIPSGFRSLGSAASSVTALGVPYAIGALAVVPVGLVRRRRHRGARRRSDRQRTAGRSAA